MQGSSFCWCYQNPIFLLNLCDALSWKCNHSSRYAAGWTHSEPCKGIHLKRYLPGHKEFLSAQRCTRLPRSFRAINETLDWLTAKWIIWSRGQEQESCISSLRPFSHSRKGAGGHPAVRERGCITVQTPKTKAMPAFMSKQLLTVEFLR